MDAKKLHFGIVILLGNKNKYEWLLSKYPNDTVSKMMQAGFGKEI